MDSIQTSDMDYEKPADIVPGTWWDLALYLAGGYGLFMLASIVAGNFLREVNLLLTTVAIGLNVVFLGGTPWVLGILRRRLSWRELGIRPARWRAEYWFIVVLGTALLIPIRAALGFLFQYLLEGGMDSLTARQDLLFPGGLTLAGLVIVGIGAGVLAPVAEELYFRGLLQGWLRQRLGSWGAVLTSSLLFGLGHYDSPGVAVSAFVMALAMGYAYDRTRSLWVPIGMHVLTNSSAILLGALAMYLEAALGLSGF